ncbi:tRNA (adenosine(37)-N6)-threonylcarbamoyltransferase complex ATPase subunit type 1 TsaE [Iodidimonas gelatinilytica]|uniref:tRNA threonylcarbamoyladenosine biosynthesis protein TsaE n=1 Tax=Iodidimonas gelatinilytica TaxID=1236966 RepID=A0A5A7MPW1_9PROT|nr:tRNA (adenosine(37)-N6)-threonylcarbamoyltransferase complex ATPase subunit type 1 TsaE [Iodidimonas gelatinilytica]GEQ97684.1 tRNA (adenosine(37)-N6)-threonylcarbamoyltransferase complex ATPase subunit type 1 TsaE [Iodidimonas gelatinilytica]GER00953.1 tRNA (adenosine(37)-N6)-threonylcarbamoyltransferase complex ATPase subunit type 1 TsaE [Iodidimonas gelatinilytica]
MTDTPSLSCPTEHSLCQLGQRLSVHLKTGDMITLSGDLGAGKTTLARAIIRDQMGDPDLAVPSPSFTLVQVYDRETAPPIWHVDLYRLESPDDLLELGIEDEVDESIIIMEWPDRADAALVHGALDLRLAIKPDGTRTVTAQGPKDWIDRIAPCFKDSRP